MGKPKTREDKFMFAGMFIGMAVAAVVAFVFAFESSTIVRYLIMAAGLVIGMFGGKLLGRRAT